MKKISKIMVILSVFALVLSLNTYASQKTYLVVNGAYIKTDVDPFIENGRTLVPIRFISENLDSKVDWNKEEKKVTITTEKEGAKVTKVELTIGSDIAKLYDKEESAKEEKLDVAAKIINGRTFVPVRFISEALRTEVGWDKENRVVLIGDASKYDAKKFKEEVVDKEAPAKKEEKKEEKRDTQNAQKKLSYDLEGDYISSSNGFNLSIIKNPVVFSDDPDVKYIGFAEGFSPMTNEYEKHGPLFFYLEKDGKSIYYLENGKKFPIKMEKNRILFLGHYWYVYDDVKSFETEDDKAYINGKEVEVFPADSKK